MPGSSKRKRKAVWTPECHQIFLDVCVEETLKGNRPGTHFTRLGYRNVLRSLNQRTGLSYDRIQVKNHWDYSKEQWKIWWKLTSTSSMKWDPETNTFGASSEAWAGYLKENPDAAPFQFKQPDHQDKLKIIFDFVMDSEDLESQPLPNILDDSSATSLFPKMLVKNEDGCDSLSATVIGLSKSGRRSTTEQNMWRTTYRRSKAVWTPELHQMFIDLCIEEIYKGNRLGSYITRDGWKNILNSFHAKTNVWYDRMQFKNHWEFTKEQWKVWWKLVCTSSMKWDPSTNRFAASEEDWKNYIQENPAAARFRIKPLWLTEKLEIMFSGITNTGESEPRRRHRRLNDDSQMSILFPEEPMTAKSDRFAERPFVAVESRSAMTVARSAATVQSTQIKPNYSIGECIECLDGMEEVEQGSDLYLFALDIFLKKEYREIFLQLKKPSVRIAWLQRLRSSGPTSMPEG